MPPLKTLFHQGKLALIQGVGYPNPNRSHFRSTEIWQTASDSDKYLKTGWIGRYFDNCCSGEDATVGVTIGSQLPQTFTAERSTGIAMTGSGKLGFGKEADASEQQVFNELNGITPDHELNIGAWMGPTADSNDDCW